MTVLNYSDGNINVKVDSSSSGVVATVTREGVVLGYCYDYMQGGKVRVFASTEMAEPYQTLREAVAATIRAKTLGFVDTRKQQDPPRQTAPARRGMPRKWHQRRDWD